MLTLEVTESVLVRDEARALVVLDELRQIGVKLALDDFGTRYPSPAYLNTLPVDAIKVDQAFIAKLSEQPSSQEIVTAIITLAHGHGMSVVSEGVETASQYQEVAQLSSDACQGSHFAKPMLPSRVEALIRDQADRGRPRLPSSRFRTQKPRTANAA